MKQQPCGCIDWRTLVISFVVVLACACATLPPAQPIRDFKDIAGKWEGTISSPPSFFLKTGPAPIVLIFAEDGTGEIIDPQGIQFISFGERRYYITQELVEGKIRVKHKASGETGIMTLHEGRGERVLVYISDDGKKSGEFKPAQK